MQESLAQLGNVELWSWEMVQAHAKWVYGSDDQMRVYLIHTEAPRFMAEVFYRDDPDGFVVPMRHELSTGEHIGNFIFL